MKKGKNMKFKMYGLAMALWALASSCDNSPKENVTVSYELLENNNPKVKECMDVELTLSAINQGFRAFSGSLSPQAIH